MLRKGDKVIALSDLETLRNSKVARVGDIGTVDRTSDFTGTATFIAIDWNNELIDHPVFISSSSPVIEKITELEIEVMKMKGEVLNDFL